MGIRTRLFTAATALALLGAPALVPSSSTALAAPDPSKGSVSLNAPAAALVGDPIVFRGRVSLKRSGLKVGLQRKVGSGWKNVDQAKTTSGGRYQLAGSVEFGGVYKFRVIRLPWLTTSARSRVATVAAYAWSNVNNMVADSGGGEITFDRSADIAGVTYPNSTVIDADSQGDPDGGFFTVDLVGLNCAALDATFGGLDGNAADSLVGGEVRLDGEVPPNAELEPFGPNDSQRVTLDVRGADLLRVEGLVAKPGPQGDLGIGTPRLLCAS